MSRVLLNLVGLALPVDEVMRLGSDSVTGFGDLIPITSLRWNAGVHNFMIYATGDIPVGAYDPTRLANIVIGHGAVDGGLGYTYFDPKTGHEFSAVGGFTFNTLNTSTQYQNGVDFHLDWGASQFLTKQFQIGLVGYLHQEVGCDSGSGDRLDASSRVSPASERSLATSSRWATCKAIST